MNAQIFVKGGVEYIAQEIPESAKKALREWVANLSQEEREELERIEAECKEPVW